MPAMLDDPSSPAIYRTSGQQPFPGPYEALAPDIMPRQVTLRDRVTTATLLPFSSPAQVPQRLTACLCDLLNREIDKGDTYPMMEPMALSHFATYWFSNFGAIMVLGDIQSPEEVVQMEDQGVDWGKECLGSFYIKPNYTGRSSHVCNGGFLVTDAARNRGVGRLMGEGYLEWAPKLGYTYSVFNLVYETNVASLRIWDALGFKRIGRVKGCGNLKSYPDQYIDAIIFGRELGDDGDDYVSEERFDKIRYYLKTGTYPNGSDRAEKSRLRSAATHYRLISNDTGDEEKLMLKGKEVISDPHKQYEIARNMHVISHGGINKTTASIAEKYHWVRIKETVSAAIRNCPNCKDSTTTSKATRSSPTLATPSSARHNLTNPINTPSLSRVSGRTTVLAGADIDSQTGLPSASPSTRGQRQSAAPIAPMIAPNNHFGPSSSAPNNANDYDDMPVDPQIMQGIEHHHHHHPHQQSWVPAPAPAVIAGASRSMVAGPGGHNVAAAGEGDNHDEGDDGSERDVSARLRARLEREMRDQSSELTQRMVQDDKPDMRTEEGFSRVSRGVGGAGRAR